MTNLANLYLAKGMTTTGLMGTVGEGDRERERDGEENNDKATMTMSKEEKEATEG
jgi:hypothetical protein